MTPSRGAAGPGRFLESETFPGPRTTSAGTGGVTPFLEAAVIADGVPKDEVYPIDIERAYASLSQTQAACRQVLGSRRPTGADADRQRSGDGPFLERPHRTRSCRRARRSRCSGTRRMLATDVWAIPKGAANAENAQKFAAFITLPVSQARLSYLIPYGSVNTARSS